MADIIAAVLIFAGGFLAGMAWTAHKFVSWARHQPQKIERYLQRVQAGKKKG